MKYLFFFILVSQTFGQPTVVPVYDFIVHRELMLSRKQHGDPTFNSGGRAASLTTSVLETKGVGKTAQAIQGEAAIQEVFGISPASIFEPVAQQFTDHLGKTHERNAELHRLFTQTYLAGQNLEQVLTNTEARRGIVAEAIRKSAFQAAQATNHADLLKLNAFQQAQNAKLAMLKLEQDAAFYRFTSLHSQTHAYAQQNAHAGKDTYLEVLRAVPTILSTVFKASDEPFKISDPRLKSKF